MTRSTVAATHDSRVADEYLTFRLGDAEYAIPILKVVEIRSVPVIRRLPGMPPHVAGVVDVRGVISAVVDLRTLMGLDARFDRFTVAVVVKQGWDVVALVVDGVTGVRPLPPAAIEPVGAAGVPIAGTPVTGVARCDDGLVLVFDVEGVVERRG